MDHPPYSMIGDIVFYVVQVAQQFLKWNRFVLMGHSMGAMASILYAGAFPETVQQLILLDGFGPDFERPNRVVDRLRQHILHRYSGNASLLAQPAAATAAKDSERSSSTNESTQPKKSKRIYKSLEDAIRTRQQTAVKSPGNQWLSYETAKEMVVWALEPAVVAIGPSSSSSPLGWEFRHDSRLYWPALQAHTLEQAFDFWKSLRNVPTLWLRAQDGWPFSKKWLDRAETFLGPLATIQTLPGSHHFHSDPDTVDQVATTIAEYLVSSLQSKSTV